MDGFQADEATTERAARQDLFAGVFTDMGRRGIARVGVVDRSLRCVWTSHPSYDRCCRSSIPAEVVLAAWRRELERGRVHGDRFFHFAWRGGVWLAYGLRDGRVRGVYCPAHSAARDERSFVPDARDAALVDEVAMTA
jgi:hypothetical protein